MKNFLIFFLLCLGFGLFAQPGARLKPGKRFEKSPSNKAGYTFISDTNGEYQHQDLNLAGYGGASTIVFAPESGVTPTVTCSPSLQEIMDWNNDGSPNLDAVIYYNCTNDATETATYVFYADVSGNMVLLESPTDPANFSRRLIPSPAFANAEAPREIEVRNYMLNLAPPPRPGTLFVQGTGAIPMAQTTDNPSTCWFYDGVNITRVKDFPRKKEVPDVAFADTLNPTVSEIITWLGVDTTYQGNYWLLYNVGSGTIEDPAWVWTVNGDYSTAQIDIVRIKKPSAVSSPTNGLQTISSAIGLGGNLTETTTNVNGSNKSMRFLMTGTGNGGFWWTNRANLYVDQDRAYIGLLDGAIGLFDAKRVDTSATIQGKYLHLKGLSALTTLNTRWYDLDFSNYFDLKAPSTIASNFTLTWPSAAPTVDGQVLTGTTAGVLSWQAAAGGGSTSYDALTSGTVTAAVTRTGSSAVTITNPGAGQYNLVVPVSTDLERGDIFFNSTTLNGSNEFILRIDNSANTRNRRAQVQLYLANTGALVDPQATGTSWTQTVSGNITTITIPNANGNGTSGFNLLIN